MDDAAARLHVLSREVGGLLAAQGLVAVTAESCTAGGIAFALTQIPGSSAWFERGMVVYSNAAKQEMLGVAAVTLRDFGAVSEPVARAMALGAMQRSGAQAAMAVTGIAGPDGAVPGKPVGTVCFAWALHRPGSATPWAQTATRHFSGDRAAVRTQAIIAALEGLRAVLFRDPGG